MSENAKESAYPVMLGGALFTGLTKRELFAAMALQGMCAADTENDWTTDQLSQWSVQCADALLAELEKKT